MSKQERPAKRYTITPDQECRLANILHSLVPNFRVLSFRYHTDECGTRVVNEDEWIKVVGTEWQQSLNIVFAIEILLKYHLISQTADKAIDTGYFEIERNKSGHDLYALYLKTEPDFKERLKTLYNQYISVEKDAYTDEYSDVEDLIDKSSELFNHFRYSFFSEVKDNGQVVPATDYIYNTLCLLALINALYDLSNLKNLCGIEDMEIQENVPQNFTLRTH